jgi:hypothetical protein
MRMKSLLAACAVLALACDVQAAELPKQFQGVWVSAGIPNKDKCTRQAPEGTDDRPLDVMMTVEGGAITKYEQYCTVQSARLQHAPNPDEAGRITMDVTLACQGEGMLWTARDIWHFETIDGARVVTVTALGQTNYRNEKGRREKAHSRVIVSIYTPCRDR